MKLAIFGLMALVCCCTAQIVVDPPAIVVYPPNSEAMEGQTVRMTCVAHGIPVPSISWVSNGVNLTALSTSGLSSRFRVLTTVMTVNGTDFRVSTFEICNAGSSDSREYQCTAQNGIMGNGVANATVTFALGVILRPRDPAAIVIRPPAISHVEVNKTVEMVCVAYGNPMPDITWSKPGCANMTENVPDGVRIFSDVYMVSNTSFRRSVIQICNIDMSDGTWYSCMASNGLNGPGLASSSATFTLMTFETPGTTQPTTPTTMATTQRPTTQGPTTIGRPAEVGASNYIAGVAAEAAIILVLLVLLIIVIAVAFFMVRNKNSMINTLLRDDAIATDLAVKRLGSNDYDESTKKGSVQFTSASDQAALVSNPLYGDDELPEKE